MIYDSFQFLNELDLLEIRLHTHDRFVDKFILTESTYTHQGNLKPLVYLDNKHLFKEFNDRIIHIVVDEFPKEMPIGKSFEENEFHFNIVQIRDTFQRMSFLNQLNFNDSDKIFMLDLDEMIDFRKLENLPDDKINSLVLNNYYYYINNSSPYTSDGGIFSRYDLLKSVVGNHPYKNLRHRSKLEPNLYKRTENIVGWHFSFLGGVNRVKYKIESWSHNEYNTQNIKDNLENNIINNIDIFGRGYKYKTIPLDESFPKYILNNRQKFSHLIYESR